MANVIDLNAVISPAAVPALLREAARQYNESAAELQSAWQDENAGRAWVELAKILDAAADKADKSNAKHFG